MAAGDGLISMTPTSIAYSGTSASINADGGVDFSAVTSLSLNGVFTGDYDNYLIVMQASVSGNAQIDMRLRASGSDNSTASSYVRQFLEADGSTAAGERVTSDLWNRFANFYTAVATNGLQAHFYGPFLAQPTAFRNTVTETKLSAQLRDVAGTHNQSTAYDGFTLLVATSPQTMTGNVHVFGYEE